MFFFIYTYSCYVYVYKLYVFCVYTYIEKGFQGGASGKEPSGQCRRHNRLRFNPWVRDDPLEEEMTTHSSYVAWEIPWTGEPCGLQSMGSKRIGHNCRNLICMHYIERKIHAYI